MKKEHFKTFSDKNSGGSALLLTVVLTSLLAIVATLFVLASRVDEATSAADVENKQLNHAAESVIELISHQLIEDLPDPNQEYYDYPDPCNAWLASLEPYRDPCDIYRWQQISDVTGYLRNRIELTPGGELEHIAVRQVRVEPVRRKTLSDYSQVNLAGGELLDLEYYDDGPGDSQWRGQSADADGDGVADSKWFELINPKDEGIANSPKGRRIFAAVRIVDNSGMLNVNTAYQFNPTDPNIDSEDIDGSSHTQIDLENLTRTGDNIDKLIEQRIGSDSFTDSDLEDYRREAIWPIVPDPCSQFTPFDIADELELRYRYVINSPAFNRLENALTTTLSTISVPYDSANSGQHRRLLDWQEELISVNPTEPEPNNVRPALTTFNLDRIIDPNLDRMVNVNEESDTNNPRRTYQKLVSGLDEDMLAELTSTEERKLKAQYAQLAVNLADFADDDDINQDGVLDLDAVTVLSVNDVNYYGFEAQPFISELGIDIAGNPAQGNSYYAVELYNPFSKRINLDEFAIVLVDKGYSPYESIKNRDREYDTGNFINFDDKNYYIEGTENPGTLDGGTFVLTNEQTQFKIADPALHKIAEDKNFVLFSDWLLPDKSKPVQDQRPGPDKSKPPVYIGWDHSYDVYLARWVGPEDEGQWILVDYQPVFLNWGAAGNEVYPYRDVRYWHIAYPTMLDRDYPANSNGNLGLPNIFNPEDFDDDFDHNFSFFLPNPFKQKRKLVTVGDVTRILAIGNSPTQTIADQLLFTEKDEEYNVRLDVQNPFNRNVFNYLTVFDPADHIDDPNEIETRIKGRININTAPWYVIAQLPWVSERKETPFNQDPDRYDLAKAIVAYRDRLDGDSIAGMPDVDYSDPCNGRYDAIEDVIDDRFDEDDIREKPGFEGIAELNFVLSGDEEPQNEQVRRRRMDYYAREKPSRSLDGFPDLTTNEKINTFDVIDTIEDDFEERDVIFSRISNLVTVRSDLFTAYILVRLGTDGPQKRLIAILDRSGITRDTKTGQKQGRVKVRACQLVPDPR